MRMQCLRILIALIGVAGFGIAVKAQVLDQIEVKHTLRVYGCRQNTSGRHI